MNPSQIWALCKECAVTVYSTIPPNVRYADATARLLFGTAAQESSLTHNRQLGMTWYRDVTSNASAPVVGGFSKWQLERCSIIDSLEQLSRDPDLCRNASLFLFGLGCRSLTWPVNLSPETVAFAMLVEGADRLGCLFARLHYFRVPSAIPDTVDDQAVYWKTFYNTAAGSGTPAQYAANWVTQCGQARLTA